jgi:hypothetical protein
MKTGPKSRFKPFECRVCDIPLDEHNSIFNIAKQREDNGRYFERICKKCHSAEVLKSKWSKKSDDDIVNEINRLKNRIDLFQRILIKRLQAI